jgi:hypothetical protein
VYGKDIRLAVSIPDFALSDDSISLFIHSIGAAAGASIQLTVLRCAFPFIMLPRHLAGHYTKGHPLN